MQNQLLAVPFWEELDSSVGSGWAEVRATGPMSSSWPASGSHWPAGNPARPPRLGVLDEAEGPPVCGVQPDLPCICP